MKARRLWRCRRGPARLATGAAGRGAAEPPRADPAWTSDNDVELFVRNVPRKFTADDLRKTFLTVCAVTSVTVPVDFNGEARGFAFVNVHAADVEDVFRKLHNFPIGGRTLSIERQTAQTAGRAADISLGKQLSACSSAADVLSVFSEKKEFCNAVHLATALHRCGTLQRSTKLDASQLKALVDAASMSLLHDSAQWDSRHIVRSPLKGLRGDGRGRRPAATRV
ncbi:hypothetical protein M885DRAFT_146890 [Pelagophyceae sp. CCMP2097]|nr:hypothetical protein M885DRAFT_146890 [Pelagophyceae sp. CCMP2097]